jgi:hypothetical protein
MRMTKLGAALASLAVAAGTTAVLSVAPAQAAGTTASQATLTIGGHAKAKAQYGDVIGLLEADVTDPAGGGPVSGSTDLQQRLPGTRWATVRTDADASDGVSFGTFGSHAKGNVQYRLHYLGDTTFAATVSNVVTVTTLWNLKDTSACPNGHCHISGKLIPRTGHHKILVQVKHGAWHKYAVLHTSAKGKYTVKVTGSRRGTKYRIIITATKHITATKKGYIVTVL